MAKNNIIMHRGDSYPIAVELMQDGVPLTAEMLEDLEFCVGKSFTKKMSRGEIFQTEGDHYFYFKPSQTDTLALRPGQYEVNVRVKYKDAPPCVDVEPVGRITILPSGFREVI